MAKLMMAGKHRSGRKWPGCAIIALLIVIAICALSGLQRPQLMLYALATSAGPTAVTDWKWMVLHSRAGDGRKNITLIGSSQISEAVNSLDLGKLLPKAKINRFTAPGFGILQYQMSVPELLKEKPDIVVCWLSEFDTFREDRLPVNRLRYTSTLVGVGQLATMMEKRAVWDNRSQLADLTTSSLLPLWRDRDLIKNIVLGKDKAAGEEEQTGPRAAIAGHIRRLENTIHRSALVDLNFASFERFAQAMHHQHIELYLFEGVTNPLAMQRYDPDSRFRRETRVRFERMAHEIGFYYIPAEHMPQFGQRDFADATHLNHTASEHFTRYLAGYLCHSAVDLHREQSREN